jgi:hypothetical protein
MADITNMQRAYKEKNPQKILRERQKTRANEKTALLEAVTAQSMSANLTNYSPEGFVFAGERVLQFLDRGVAFMQYKSEGNPLYEVELARRRYEYQEQYLLETEAAQGTLDWAYKVVFSPFPDDMDEQVSRELGYDPHKKTAKVRIHNFDSQTGENETTEIIFADSLQKRQQLLTMLGPNDKSLSSLPATAILGQIFSFPKSEYAFGDLVKKLGAILFDENQAEQVSVGSVFVAEKGTPFIKGLARLDEELAKSLLERKPTNAVANALEQIQFFAGLSEGEQQILANAHYVFTEGMARLIKKIALTNTYLQVALLTDNQKVVGLAVDKRALTMNADLFFNPYLSEIMMDMMPVNISFCGGSFEAEGSYGFEPRYWSEYLFGRGAPNEKRVTHCPNCKTTLLLNREHIDKGIACRCGSRVPRGVGAECIFENSKSAQGHENNRYEMAGFDSNWLETWD